MTMFALYPRSTFHTQQALVFETVGAGQDAGRQKYIDRRWTMIQAPSLSRKSELRVRMVRWVGDSFTWTISLPRFLAKTMDLYLINSWQLDCDDEMTWTTSELLANPVLEYNYIISGSGTLSAVSDDVFAFAHAERHEALCLQTPVCSWLPVPPVASKAAQHMPAQCHLCSFAHAKTRPPTCLQPVAHAATPVAIYLLMPSALLHHVTRGHTPPSTSSQVITQGNLSPPIGMQATGHYAMWWYWRSLLRWLWFKIKLVISIVQITAV
ncbi:hypothetical protein B0H13DRAFT_1900273 [Mycena leptocephala]|nr:hypothetical protein B0H13DRAFT_1900273 [Mycena leptocephala]